MTTYVPRRTGPPLRPPEGIDRSSFPGEGSARPYISVIVTAHDRVQFLRGAVESVLAQSLRPEEFEIVVVKYEHEPVLDSWLDGQRPRVRTITDPTRTRLGQKLALGAQLAQGEVRCFLEDDDRYLPEKLATVAARFRADPSLVYFRNRTTCIDALGRPLIGPYARVADRELIISDTSASELAIVDFLRHYGAEGNSAIAVRRERVLPQLDRLDRFSTSTDLMVFVAALAGRGTLAVGTQPLSQYRAHASFSQGPTPASRRQFAREIMEASEILLEMGAGTRAERAVRFLRARGSVNRYLIDPESPRPSVGEIRDAAWPAWLRREPTFAIQLGWCGLRFLAPHATARAFWGYRQRDAERQGWTPTEGASSGTPGDSPSGMHDHRLHR